MKKIFLTLLSIATICFSDANAQTKVIPGITKGKDYGIVYTLPKSSISIQVTTKKIVYTPGALSKYAKYYLKLSEVSNKPDEHWEIENIVIKTEGIPNNKKSYFVKLKDKTIAPLMELTENGIIKSINVPYSNEPQKEKSNKKANEKRAVNPKEFFTEEILMASSTAKIAELVAKEIYNIRESKNALLRGQADFMPKDGQQLKIMIDNLNLQEETLTSMFAGTYTSTQNKVNITLPADSAFNHKLVFRFSKKLGIVDENDLAGRPFYASLKDLKTLDIPLEREDKEEGIAYNIPGTGMVTLYDGNKIISETKMPITQFGTTGYLAPVLFNKKSTLQVIFDPTTGGIIKVDKSHK